MLRHPNRENCSDWALRMTRKKPALDISAGIFFEILRAASVNSVPQW